MARTMRLQISPDLLYFLVIIQCFAAQEFRLDSQGICGSTVSQTPTCLQQNVELDDIELDCSESNIRIGYPKNLGILQHDASDITSRSLREIRLECSDERHETAARINCSINRTSIGKTIPDPESEHLEEYIISNITEVGIVTGLTCYVSGCYSYLIRGKSSPLIVVSRENCTIPVPPTVTADSATVVTIEGNTVALVCNATGDPVPVQTSSRNGNELMSGGQYQISLDGRVLIVQGVTEAQDEGEFTCHASNVAGNDSATIMLNVQVMPLAVATPTSQELSAGEIALFDCETYGDPAPQVRWLNAMSVDVTSLSDPRIEVLTNGTLIISNLRASDQQQYMCEANSSIGRSVSNATLSLLVIEDAAAVMNSNVVLFASMIPVSLTLLFIIMLLIVLAVLRCKKQQKVRARHALFVLDDKDMVFNPNHTPPVCVHKPSFNFNHRKISVVSVDLIQNLTHSDMAAFEKCDTTVTTDKPGEPPHYKYAVQNSIGDSDDVLMISGNSTEYNIPEQSVELPAMSSDAHSSSIMQLTSEAETSESTTCGSLNAQNNTLIQDNSVEHGDTLQLGLTSVNNQIPAMGTVGDDNNIKRFTASDNQPNQSSIAASRPGDNMIQLDQSANIECNRVYSLSQSTNYIVLTPQKNHQGQQTPFISLADRNIKLEDNTMNVLDAINTSAIESPISGQLPPTSSTNDQLNITNECDQELDISTLVITASQEDALSFDSERGSMLSLDLTGDIPEPLKYSDQLKMNHNRTLSDNGYL